MSLTEPECKVCGQREGPFPGIREAGRVLEPHGWLRAPPPEAWRGGHWAGGYPHSWYCPQHRAQWEREVHARHPPGWLDRRAIGREALIAGGAGT